MKTLFEILKVMLPAFITGVFTFLVTKYTYKRNKPLDKMEISYNRVYYPIYKIISDNNINNDVCQVISKCKTYFDKYDKYVDISTKKLFDRLNKSDTEAKRISIYQSFIENIYSKNSYLRRMLGYLEPNFFQIYKYSSPYAKSLFRICVEFLLLYCSVLLSTITMNFVNRIYFYFTMLAFLTFFIICILEIIWCLLRFIYYKIRK